MTKTGEIRGCEARKEKVMSSGHLHGYAFWGVRVAEECEDVEFVIDVGGKMFGASSPNFKSFS